MILTDEQKAVVEHHNGPALCLAGPGTGKTRCITSRVLRLVEEGVSPGNILCVTFTRRATREMSERITEALGRDRAAAMTMSTLHSMGLKILRKYGRRVGVEPNFTICDDREARRIIKQVMMDERHTGNEFEIVSLVKSMNGRLKRKMERAEDIRDDPKISRKDLLVWRGYLRALNDLNKLDFDDLQYRAWILLEEHADVLEELQDRWTWIQVDEAQDLSLVQYVLAKKLAERDRNIVLVGDYNQSIFKFRHAEIGNLDTFQKDFPETEVYCLTMNFRSSPEIIRVSEKVIGRNTQRQKVSAITNNPSGGRITLTSYNDTRQEAFGVAERIKESIKRGVSPAEVAVIFRTNAMSRPLEESMSVLSVPYVVRGSASFWERMEILDAMATLRFAANPLDYESFSRVCKNLLYRVGLATTQKIVEARTDVDTILDVCLELRDKPSLVQGMPRKTRDSVVEFATFVSRSQNGSPSGFLLQMAKSLGFLERLEAMDKKDGTYRYDNFMELVALASEYEKRTTNASIVGFLDDVSSAYTPEEESEQNSVTLMTFHTAKGLEFDTVYIVGLEENVIPHYRSVREASPKGFDELRKAVEEERRLFYVGVTRAKRFLHLSCCRYRETGRQVASSQPSRFAEETEVVMSYAESQWASERPRPSVKGAGPGARRGPFLDEKIGRKIQF